MRTNVAVAYPPPRTHEGAVVNRIGSLAQLRRSVLACLLWEGEFYEDGQRIAERIKAGVAACDFHDVGDLAVDARTKFNLRHVPLLLVRELARLRAPVAPYLSAVIQRPDELSEFLSLYWQDGKCPLSAQVKKGLAEAFTQFSEYSLAKYNQDRAIKLRDVLFLCHAKPKNPEQAALWKRLAEGTLATPDTWEVELSASQDKKASWNRLLHERKLGALALLRNLRNMLNSGIEKDDVRAALEECRTDRVLPFRFIAAARAVPQWEDIIEPVMLRAADNYEKLPGKTALIVDTSPSMWMANVSQKSDMDRFDAAAALAILCRELCDEVNVYAFNKTAYDIPARRGFALRDALATTKDGYSCGGLAVQRANEQGYDRIIVITDGQWHVINAAEQEKARLRNPWAFGHGVEGDAKEVSPSPLTDRAYMINVASYQNGVGYGKWTSIDGFSEAVLDFVRFSEAN